MPRKIRWTCAVVAVALLCSRGVEAQEPPPGVPAKPAPVPRPPDFKVVIWYHAGTWHALAYDVRKGEFHAAVEDWVRTMNGDPYGEAAHILLPQVAYIKEVRLVPNPGAPAVDDRAIAIKEAQDWLVAKQDKLLQDKLRAATSGDLHRLRLYPPGRLGYTGANAWSRPSDLANRPAPVSPTTTPVPTYLLVRPR